MPFSPPSRRSAALFFNALWESASLSFPIGGSGGKEIRGKIIQFLPASGKGESGEKGKSGLLPSFFHITMEVRLVLSRTLLLLFFAAPCIVADSRI